MPYAILRFKKIRSRRHLASAWLHNARIGSQPNIDPERSHLNRAWRLENGRYVKDVSETEGGLNGRLLQKLQEVNVVPPKKSVIAVEVMLTASPEAFEDPDKLGSEERLREWIRASLGYAEYLLGGRRNILSVHVHHDEATPHMHVIAVPLVRKVDGRRKSKEPIWKLDAKGLLRGSSPAALSEIQQEYGRMMSRFGLRPGRSRAERQGERTRHVPIKDHQLQLQATRDVALAELDRAAEAAEEAAKDRQKAAAALAEAEKAATEIREAAEDRKKAAEREIEELRERARKDRESASEAFKDADRLRKQTTEDRAKAATLRQEAEQIVKATQSAALREIEESRAKALLDRNSASEALTEAKKEADRILAEAEADAGKALESASLQAEATLKEAREQARKERAAAEEAIRQRQAAEDAKIIALERGLEAWAKGQIVAVNESGLRLQGNIEPELKEAIRPAWKTLCQLLTRAQKAVEARVTENDIREAASRQVTPKLVEDAAAKLVDPAGIQAAAARLVRADHIEAVLSYQVDCRAAEIAQQAARIQREAQWERERGYG